MTIWAAGCGEVGIDGNEGDPTTAVAATVTPTASLTVTPKPMATPTPRLTPSLSRSPTPTPTWTPTLQPSVNSKQTPTNTSSASIPLTPTPTTPPTNATPDPTESQDKFVATDGDSMDRFGSSVALVGDIAFISAHRDEHPRGTNAGAAYVFERSDGRWNQSAKLSANDGESEDVFGWTLALDGETAIIGAPGDEDPHGDAAGSAYVYERSGNIWEQVAKLTADDGDSKDQFGWSVALTDTTALVGAPRDEDPFGKSAGSAYVFEKSEGSWNQAAKLAADDGDAKDRFGWSVAIDGLTALIGAPIDEDPNEDAAGSAYAFERSGGSWDHAAKLVADEGDSKDQFGWSLALNRKTALIGAVRDEDSNGNAGGSAYVFERSDGSWAQTATLEAADGDNVDLFGNSVALGAGIGVVGAYWDEDPNGIKSGSSYVFERSDGSWAQKAKLVATDGDSQDRFGRMVAIDDDTVLVGAYLDEDDNGYSAGSAYAFVL